MKCIHLDTGIIVFYDFKPLYDLPLKHSWPDLLNQIIWIVFAWLIFKGVKLAEE